jgi:hypothetical protein
MNWIKRVFLYLYRASQFLCPVCGGDTWEDKFSGNIHCCNEKCEWDQDDAPIRNMRCMK